MEQILLDSLSKAYDGLEMTGNNLHGFPKGKLCLSNLIAFYDETISYAADGKAVDVIYPIFTIVFRMVSHSILSAKW